MKSKNAVIGTKFRVVFYNNTTRVIKLSIIKNAYLRFRFRNTRTIRLRVPIAYNK